MHHVGLLGQNLGCLFQNVECVFLLQSSLAKEVFLQESMIGLHLSMFVLKKELCIRGFIHRRRRDTLDGSLIEVWGILRKALAL